MMRVIALSIALGGCSARFDLGGPREIVAPPGSAVIETPSGEIIEPSPIETIITGLKQAQEVRTLTRQLAR